MGKVGSRTRSRWFRSASTLAVATFCSLSGASGASAYAHGGERLAKLDSNGDGLVSVQEFESHELARFAKADANRDGKLSEEERNESRESRHRERFARQDINGDGVLERSEVEEMPIAVFFKIDTDKSGGLNPTEMKNFAKAMRAEQGPAADADGDGLVTQAEAIRRARAKFQTLDTNRDGRLVEEELDARPAGHGQSRRP